MSFDDRLRNHLQNQNEMIEVTAEGPAAVADRHARRSRNRMAASACAVALVVVGGFAAWTQSGEPFEQETTIAAPAEEADDTAADDSTDANTELADDDVTQDDVVQDVDATTTTISVEAIERVDPGAPDSVWNVKTDGGVYYVLSTAPGETGLDENGNFDYDFNYRPNTIYRFDEATGWSNAEVTDRWISDFAPSDGVLYILSTGRTDGSSDPAIGVSGDQGATWDWQSVPDLAAVAAETFDGFSDTTLRLLPVGDRQFLLAQSLGFPDWEEGIDLARSAGLNITDLQVVDLNANGITYRPPSEGDPQQECWNIRSEFNDASNEIWQEYDGLYEEAGAPVDYVAIEAELNGRIDAIAPPFEARLVDAGCVNEIACDRISRAYWMLGQELWLEFGPDNEPAPEVIADIEAQLLALRTAEAPKFEAELEAAGCENFIQCELISSGIHAQYANERAELDSAYANYDNLTEEEIEVLSIREQALWSKIEAETQTALEGTDCWSGEDYYYEEDIYAPENITTVTWAELGVTPPASWGPSSEYFEVRNGQLESLGAAPFDGEIVVNVGSGPDGPELLSITPDAWYGNEGPGSATAWTTGDGVTWTRTGTSDSPYAFGGPGPLTVGQVSLRINWGEEPDLGPADFPAIPADAEILTTEDGEPYFVDGSGGEVLIPLPVDGPTSTLERSVAGGAWEAIDIGVLAPELSGQSVYIDNLIDTAIGAVVITQSVNADRSSPTSSPAHVLYSSDGETWQTVTLDADWVSAVSAGDSVLLLGSKNTPQGEQRTPPATVLIRPAR